MERYVRTTKSMLRMFLSECKGGNWWEFLQDVAMGLRIVPTKATGLSPFVLVYKQQPCIPLVSALHCPTEVELEEAAAE